MHVGMHGSFARNEIGNRFAPNSDRVPLPVSDCTQELGQFSFGVESADFLKHGNPHMNQFAT